MSPKDQRPPIASSKDLHPTDDPADLTPRTEGPAAADVQQAVAAAQLAPVSLTFEQLKELLAIGSASRSSSPELELALKSIQSQLSATEGLRDQVKRTVRMFNAEHEHISAFNYDPDCEHCLNGTRHPEPDASEVDQYFPDSLNKRGHPKLKLKRQTYFPKTAKVTDHEATVLETKLFNALGDKVAQLGKIEARNGLWSAWVTRDDKILFVDVPHYLQSQRDEQPPLVQVLLELIQGKQAADPENLISAVFAMQRRIAQLEAQLAGQSFDASSVPPWAKAEPAGAASHRPPFDKR